MLLRSGGATNSDLEFAEDMPVIMMSDRCRKYQA